MSNLPDPIPAPENNAPVAPRLTLTPKPPAPVASPLVPPVVLSAPSAEAEPAAVYVPAPAAVLAPKPSLRLQGNLGAGVKLASADAFTSPMPKRDVAADAVHPGVAVIAGLAATVAVTFAVLLFLKSQ